MIIGHCNRCRALTRVNKAGTCTAGRGCNNTGPAGPGVRYTVCTVWGYLHEAAAAGEYHVTAEVWDSAYNRVVALYRSEAGGGWGRNPRQGAIRLARITAARYNAADGPWPAR